MMPSPFSPAGTALALEAAAASDRRPVSQYVRNLILDAVDGERERQVERVAR